MLLDSGFRKSDATFTEFHDFAWLWARPLPFAKAKGCH